MHDTQLLLMAVHVMVVLTFVVCLRLLAVRVREMKQKRFAPQATSTSLQAAARYEDVRASDNFRNLLEVPVLFYALAAVALATGHVPGWLVVGAWAFVVLRIGHSLIQCTYNDVMHRFAVFLAGFALIVGLWTAFVFTVPSPR